MTKLTAMGYIIGALFFTLVVFGLGFYYRGTKESKLLKCNSDTTWLAEKVIVSHDTLVYLVTQDSVKESIPESSFMRDGGWEIGKIFHFENGRTKDTIYKHEIIYY